jgi:sporulation protein YlmC with PRC-barrel domain
MGAFSSPPGGESSNSADPVSWLQIAQGWSVVTSDGMSIGSVSQVEGDKQDDIFDGLAVQPAEPGQIVYVPGEQVGLIYPGQVTLQIASAEISNLEPFQSPPPETKWVPGKPPGRLSRWLRGGR